MKVPLKWLNDFVEVSDIAPAELARKLQSIGVAIESVEDRNPHRIHGVVVGKIAELAKHPNADRLKVCQVDFGDKKLQILTAAPNVKQGDVVPVALVGAEVVGEGSLKKIEKAKMRGETSEGMMCSAAELGIEIKDLPVEQREGVLIFPPDTPLGADVLDLYAISETVLEIEPFANRPDYLSIIGIAREVSALLGRPLKPLDTAYAESDPPAEQQIKVAIDDTSLCPLYTARVIDSVTVGPTPLWMVGRLHAAGIRSVNNVVDITNYVMWETGQPLHAFDYHRVEGARITVRPARAGEKMKSIDGVDRDLDEKMLVIADAARPVAIAGVMGGLDSEVSEATSKVLLESATFHQASVRRTSTRLALRSESSKRFEKGLDYHNADLASKRAAALLAKLCGGRVSRGVVSTGVEPPKPVTVRFRPARANRVLGSDIAAQRMYEILRALHFELTVADHEATALVPSFRLDVRREEDLIEEVARHFGYDNIPSTLPLGRTNAGRSNPKDRGEERVRDLLVALGFHEAITFSLLHPSSYEAIRWTSRDDVVVRNPLVADQSALRTTLLPHLLKVVEHNMRVRVQNLAFFEISKIYLTIGDGPPQEKRLLSLIVANDAAEPFFVLKGQLVELFSHLGVTVQWAPLADAPGAFHPGKAATLTLGTRPLGPVAALHPAVIDSLDIKSSVKVPEIVFAEMDLDLLIDSAIDVVTYRPISRFPEVERDLALVVEEKVASGQLEGVIWSAGGEHVRVVRCFDVYRGSQIPEHHKSMAYSITFQAAERTLTDAEIEKAMSDIIGRLDKELGARVRT